MHYIRPEQVARKIEVRTWEFSMRPAVPLYWRCTPTECSPFLRSAVSFTTKMAPRITEGVDDVIAQVIAHRVGVPLRP
jgi:hypothetical protein